jgi:hypothetical protein
VTELLCDACQGPKASADTLCRRCTRALDWPLRAALWAAVRNLARHPHEAGARARYRAAKAAAIRALRPETTPEPAA